MIYRQFGTNNPEFTAKHPSFRSEIEQTNPLVQVYDPESADLKLARSLADEQINISGAEVKVYTRTDNADHDKVFQEDADPTYHNPIPFKAFCKPQPLEAELKKWGQDVSNRLDIVFSHLQLFERFGKRMLRPGDVIQVPYNAAAIKPKNYVVKNGTPSGNFRYNWLYFTVTAELLTADITVRPEQDMNPGQYYES